jgi:hypothetical protein
MNQALVDTHRLTSRKVRVSAGTAFVQDLVDVVIPIWPVTNWNRSIALDCVRHDDWRDFVDESTPRLKVKEERW